jgi:hypothetical protein
MARKVKATGKCRICGKDSDLSFEHVPPQKAFNNQRLIAYSVEGWVTKKEVKGRPFQRGAGAYTLCKQCNNDTGAWYANEFVKWSLVGADVLQLLEQQKEQFGNLSEIMVVFQDVYPVRFLKQIITCFFSVMGANTDAAFAAMNPDLVRFVLDRDGTYLPESYHFYLKLYQKSILRRYPMGGKITITYTKTENGISLLGATSAVFSEITHFPFALIMTQDKVLPEATDITHFKNYKYDDLTDISLRLSIGQGRNPYPGSY